ncbi:MAG: SRPBCC domain-containing protein [Roseiarcus sp.]
MAYNFKLVTTIPATPEAIYDAWLDGAAHSAMTGAEATASDKVGASFTAWDGYIHGRNIELVKGRRIVQSWRTSEFSDGEPDSTISVTLSPVKGGAELTLEHANAPEDQRGYEEGGWEDNYFKPMKKYFSKRKPR